MTRALRGSASRRTLNAPPPAGPLRNPLRRVLAILFAFVVVAASLGPVRADAPAVTARKHVVLAKVDGMIDLGLGPFVDRVLSEAESSNAAAVVLEVNTFGGRVDAAVLIRDHLLRSRVRSVAFVNKRAISAGALISLAAEKVVMAKGATIGAATPVKMGEETEPVGEKTVSYVRKEFRATADARNRPGAIAEAMVDPDVEIAGVIDKGKLLTLTTAEALTHGVADFEADDVPALLAALDLEGAEVRPMNENWAEHIVRFLTHPAIASLLMTLAILGIVIELRTPGFGIPGAVGLTSLVAFFWGHWLVELVGFEQVLLVIVGVVLIGLEVFVIPGFGLAGVLGILALVGGLGSSLIGAGASMQAMTVALLYVIISAAVAAVLAAVLWRFFSILPAGRKLVLEAELKGGSGGEPVGSAGLVGVMGTTLTPLRPAGIADLAGRRVDVVSDGEFIESGQQIQVVLDEGTRIVVKRHGETQEGKK
jgi:membrane-bound serine protease (ClpP class)